MMNLNDLEMGKERYKQLLHDAEKHRLVQSIQGQSQPAEGYRVKVREAGQRVWAQRWRVLPVMVNAARNADSAETEEIPGAVDYGAHEC